MEEVCFQAMLAQSSCERTKIDLRNYIYMTENIVTSVELLWKLIIRVQKVFKTVFP